MNWSKIRPSLVPHGKTPSPQRWWRRSYTAPNKSYFRAESVLQRKPISDLRRKFWFLSHRTQVNVIILQSNQNTISKNVFTSHYISMPAYIIVIYRRSKIGIVFSPHNKELFTWQILLVSCTQKDEEKKLSAGCITANTDFFQAEGCLHR